MYSKIDSTWLKHWDFILLDMLMIQIAYVFSYIIRMGLVNPYKNKLYLSIGVILCLADILCSVLYRTIPRNYAQRIFY